jgi:two-component system response regulator (stage 0 sporulation protein A)
MKIKERIVSETLRRIGVPCNIKGFYYLKDAVSIVVEDPSMVSKMTTELYLRIAIDHRATPSSVERSIRKAIDLAWTAGDRAALKEALHPYPMKRKMCNGLFVATLSENLRLQQIDKAV